MRKSIVFIHIFIIPILFFFLSEFPRFLLLSFLRTSFSFIFRVGLSVTHSLNFPLFQNVLFILHSWRIFLPDTESWVDSNFLLALENVVPHPSGFHNFRWEISCHSNSFSPISKVSFISHCFQDFFPLGFISFHKFDYDVPWCIFLLVILFDVHSASWLYRFVSFVLFGIFFSYYFFEYFFSPSFFLICFWFSSDTNRSFVIVLQVREGMFIFFSVVFLSDWLAFIFLSQVHWFFPLSHSAIELIHLFFNLCYCILYCMYCAFPFCCSLCLQFIFWCFLLFVIVCWSILMIAV